VKKNINGKTSLAKLNNIVQLITNNPNESFQEKIGTLLVKMNLS